MAIKLSPKFAMAYLNRGIFMTEIRNKHEEALKDFNMAIFLNSKYTIAYYHRALVKKELIDLDGYKLDIEIAADLGHKKSIELKNNF